MTPRSRGFSLIEVLVAVAIFGMLTAIAYATLGSVLNNTEMLNARMDRLQAIQRTMRYIGNDLSTAVPRPVRDQLGDCCEPAVSVSAFNDYLLAVTHGGWPNPAGRPRSTLQRSVYQLDEGTLLRIYFPVLDATYDSEPVVTEILDGVLELRFNLLLPDGETVDQWPPDNLSAPASWLFRPSAVEIVLTLEDEGEIRRIVEVAS